jgi:hypothetical protein
LGRGLLVLRLWVSGLLSWVALLPVISEALPYDGRGLALAWAVALALLWWPRLSRTSWIPLFALLLGLCIGVWRWADGSFADAFSEPLGVAIALVLVWGIARALNHMERWPRPEARPGTTDPMFREVCRARRYDRALSLLALELRKDQPTRAGGTAEVAALLREATRDHDLVSEREGHLLAAFPEIGTGELPALTARIEALVHERLGVALRIGSASFREDAITYDALVRQSFEALERTPPVPEVRGEDAGEMHQPRPGHARVA